MTNYDTLQLFIFAMGFGSLTGFAFGVLLYWKK